MATTIETQNALVLKRERIHSAIDSLQDAYTSLQVAGLSPEAGKIRSMVDTLKNVDLVSIEMQLNNLEN